MLHKSKSEYYNRWRWISFRENQDIGARKLEFFAIFGYIIVVDTTGSSSIASVGLTSLERNALDEMTQNNGHYAV